MKVFIAAAALLFLTTAVYAGKAKGNLAACTSQSALDEINEALSKGDKAAWQRIQQSQRCFYPRAGSQMTKESGRIGTCVVRLNAPGDNPSVPLYTACENYIP